MSKGGSGFGFIATLIGGIASIFVAVNLIYPDIIKQLLAAYYALIGASLCMLAFRIKRARTVHSASIITIVLGVISLNPFALLGGIVGVFTRPQIEQSKPLALYTYKPTPKVKSSPRRR